MESNGIVRRPGRAKVSGVLVPLLVWAIVALSASTLSLVSAVVLATEGHEGKRTKACSIFQFISSAVLAVQALVLLPLSCWRLEERPRTRQLIALLLLVFSSVAALVCGILGLYEWNHSSWSAAEAWRKRLAQAALGYLLAVAALQSLVELLWACLLAVLFYTGRATGPKESRGTVHHRTSQTHPLEVNFIERTRLESMAATPLPSTAAVAMCGAPGRNKGRMWRRNLEADLQRLSERGVQVVVTLVRMEELIAMGLAERFRATVVLLGMEWLHFPIHDKWVPDSMREFHAFLQQLVERLEQGLVLCIHCNGGRGRTGLVTSALLYALSAGARSRSDCVAAVRGARPRMLRNPFQQLYLLHSAGL